MIGGDGAFAVLNRPGRTGSSNLDVAVYAACSGSGPDVQFLWETTGAMRDGEFFVGPHGHWLIVLGTLFGSRSAAELYFRGDLVGVITLDQLLSAEQIRHGSRMTHLTPWRGLDRTGFEERDELAFVFHTEDRSWRIDLLGAGGFALAPMGPVDESEASGRSEEREAPSVDPALLRLGIAFAGGWLFAVFGLAFAKRRAT